MRPHPRLFVPGERLERLRDTALPSRLAPVRRTVLALARRFLADPPERDDRTGHNWHLVRARRAQRRAITLATAHFLTGESRYRVAALGEARRIIGWKDWAWAAWRGDRWRGRPVDESRFDLAHGENAMTLALLFDWFRPALGAAERRLMVRAAEGRVFRPYVALCSRRPPLPWYYRNPHSNWNTVCNGGAGMLALTMFEESPRLARRTLALVERGIRPFFATTEPDGAWPEGLAYWGYGMRYGFYYLLSWERAMARRHPLLARRGVRRTVRFPLLFSPRGLPCSFGDLNSFSPIAFHRAAAGRVGDAAAVGELDRRAVSGPRPVESSWPEEAERLLTHPGTTRRVLRPSWPTAAVFRGPVTWGLLADRWPEPDLYVAARGGSGEVPHGHQDLMSFHLVAGGERVVENVPVRDYHDATFGARRYDLYETAAASKNVVLINGIGPGTGGRADLRVIRRAGADGLKIVGTTAYAGAGGVTRAERFILRFGSRAVLVVDRVRLRHPGWIEARFHTFAGLTTDARGALIGSRGARVHAALAATVPARVAAGRGLPTELGSPAPRVLRHQTAERTRSAVLAALFTRGGAGRVSVRTAGGRTMIRIGGPVRRAFSL